MTQNEIDANANCVEFLYETKVFHFIALTLKAFQLSIQFYSAYMFELQGLYFQERVDLVHIRLNGATDYLLLKIFPLPFDLDFFFNTKPTYFLKDKVVNIDSQGINF